jgi:hypothetical protein
MKKDFSKTFKEIKLNIEKKWEKILNCKCKTIKQYTLKC